jgi:hypothetical protein
MRFFSKAKIALFTWRGNMIRWRNEAGWEGVQRGPSPCTAVHTGGGRRARLDAKSETRKNGQDGCLLTLLGNTGGGARKEGRWACCFIRECCGGFVTGLINPSQLPAAATDLSPPLPRCWVGSCSTSQHAKSISKSLLNFTWQILCFDNL